MYLNFTSFLIVEALSLLISKPGSVRDYTRLSRLGGILGFGSVH